MADDGELVKLECGRWARFQRCHTLHGGQTDHEEAALLVAVELDDHFQDLLNEAEGSLESYRQRGIPVKLRLDPESQGAISFSFEHLNASPQ